MDTTSVYAGTPRHEQVSFLPDLPPLLSMAALLASRNEPSIPWEWRAGRAVYTNAGEDTETVEPFGVPVQRGESLVVTWLPGETAYTVLVQHDAHTSNARLRLL